ncbi:hypothetical protein T492DRAFT_845720 [Pavlovales sp. CCMP2436]|nr:hypothetical protein T492DRAFT_845720 [Pavlovales sp. CCMP2436]
MLEKADNYKINVQAAGRRAFTQLKRRSEVTRPIGVVTTGGADHAFARWRVYETLRLATRFPTVLALRGVEGVPLAACAFVGYSSLLIATTLALAAAAHLAVERPALKWIRQLHLFIMPGRREIRAKVDTAVLFIIIRTLPPRDPH